MLPFGSVGSNSLILILLFLYLLYHKENKKYILSKINTATKEITVNNQKVIFFSNIIRII